MFKYRKYKMKFRKIGYPAIYGTVVEVKDSELSEEVLKLKEKYDFDVLEMDFRNWHDDSFLVIKCKKEDRLNIFSSFCRSLEGKIENTSF